MAGENNITQIYDTSKEIVLPKNTQYVNDGNINVFFEFDSAEQGNAFIATGNYTEEFSVPASGATVYTMPPDGNLVLYYKLDETSGSTATDTQGSYNGTLVNMEDPGDWQTGQTNNGLSFGGTDEYIDVNNSLESIFQSAFSISFWLNATDATPSPSSQYILGTQDSIGNSTMRIQYTTSGAVGAYWRSNSGTPLTKDSGAAHVSDTVFDNWVIIFYESGGEVLGKIYKNTVDVTSSTVGITDTMSSYSNTSRDLWIGYHNDSSSIASWYFNGMLDEIRIYNIELTTDHIQALYYNDI